jgi:hypothetical protein
MELIISISEFFDRAIYHTIAGYEDARRTVLRTADDDGLSEGNAVKKPSSPGRAPASMYLDEGITVSRGGDIGESSG